MVFCSCSFAAFFIKDHLRPAVVVVEVEQVESRCEVKYFRWKQSRQHRSICLVLHSTSIAFRFHVFIQQISRRKFRSAHSDVRVVKNGNLITSLLPKHFSSLRNSSRESASKSETISPRAANRTKRTNRENAFQSS